MKFFGRCDVPSLVSFVQAVKNVMIRDKEGVTGRGLLGP